MADSTATNATWTNITSNVFAITHNPFGDPTLTERLLRNLTSIQADWPYVIPDDLSSTGGSTHPVLYVAGEGGVYRSLNNGISWTLFPDPTIDGSAVAGGYLPNAHVTDLDISLGNIDPTTGRAIGVPGDPDVLVASTYGRSAFAIRLAPVIVPGTIVMTPATGVINNSNAPTFTGLSAQTAFGNHVRISIVDLTD